MEATPTMRPVHPIRHPARSAVLALGLVAVLATGCFEEHGAGDLLAPSGDPIVVVDASLIVGWTFPTVLVSRTLSPDRAFAATDALIEGAEVIIRSEHGEEYLYEGWPDSPGLYRPVDSGPRVLAETTYALEVITPAGEVVRATTVTPPTFRVDDWVLLDPATNEVRRTLVGFGDVAHPAEAFLAPENQLVHAEGILEARFDRPPAAAFQLAMWSLDPESELVVDADFLDENDLDDFDRIETSPAFLAPEGRIRVPWLAFFFEGPYRLNLYAVDRNWYDLLRSMPALGDGGLAFGNPGGQSFEEPIFHIEGGIGLFGSASVDSVGVVIHPPAP